MIKDAPVLTEKPWSCDRCEDKEAGFDLVIYRETQKLVKCECYFKRLRVVKFNRAISITPKRFSENFGIIDGLNSAENLRDLTPDGHKLIANLRKRPEQSYYFWGKTGKYKTALAWALLQESGRMGYSCGGNDGRALVNTLSDYQFKQKLPKKDETFYSISQIENNEEKFCVLIDDIEVMKVSDYSLATLFEIVEKCQVYNHRLIITSNKSINELMKKFVKSDRDGSANAEDYCEKLLRRLKEYCLEIEIK